MTKFTPATREIILDAIGNHGLPITTACEAAGISPTTYQKCSTPDANKNEASTPNSFATSTKRSPNSNKSTRNT